MGLLSTKLMVTDARLVVGAYITKGICLYRVDRETSSQFILENAWTGVTTSTTASDILANYEIAHNHSEGERSPAHDHDTFAGSVEASKPA